MARASASKAEAPAPVTPAAVAGMFGLDPDTPWRYVSIELDWGAPAVEATQDQPGRPARPTKVIVTADAQDHTGASQAHKQYVEVLDEQGA